MENTMFIGKVYQRFVEIPSTNDFATEWASKSRPAEGAVVRADNQSAGKGQFGSRWQSDPGKNLLISVILYPHWLSVAHQFYLSIVAATAVKDTLDRLEVENTSIKWPNDLMIGNKKTAGILIQNSLKGTVLNAAVIGIGLNVNQTLFNPDLPHATSMAIASQKTYDLQNVETALLSSLEQRYLQLKAGKHSELEAYYNQHLYRRNEWGPYILKNGSRFEARLTGVKPESGHLCLEHKDGRKEYFDQKAVHFEFPS